LTVLGLNPGWRQPLDVIRLRRYLDEMRPQIVHTFLLTASLYGRLAAALARVPVIIGTEVNIYERKERHHIWAERALMKRTDVVVASADAVRDYYIRQVHADPRRVEVIYNAVDWRRLDTTMTRPEIRAALGLPDDAMAITIIARLTEQKAHAVLFDAIHATPSLAAAHVVVVGDGELRAALEQRAAALALTDRIHFVGARRDLGNVLAATDIFVMPSLWEGLPLSLVLAMGAGLPVVATRVAGIPEVVRDGQTGLLVDPGRIAPLGDALALLAGDPSLRARLGRAAAAFVGPRFGVEQYIEATVALYDRLLASKGLAGA
jgi:glycosyltransferase involved in cell wall biosynthesis